MRRLFVLGLGVVVVAAAAGIAAASGPVTLHSGDRHVGCNMSHHKIWCAAWATDSTSANPHPIGYGFGLGRKGVQAGEVYIPHYYWELRPGTRHRWRTHSAPEWLTHSQLFGYSFFRPGIACKWNYTTVTCRQNREGAYYMAKLNRHQLEVFRKSTSHPGSRRVFLRRWAPE